MFKKRIIKGNDSKQAKRVKLNDPDDDITVLESASDESQTFSAKKIKLGMHGDDGKLKVKTDVNNDHNSQYSETIVDKLSVDANLKESSLDSDHEDGANGIPKKSDSTRIFSFGMKSKARSKQIKQADNLQNTLLIDYQPDVCKDYKQTGYCGYGDSCKFLHFREAFKVGDKVTAAWKIDDSIGELDTDQNLKIPIGISPTCVICGKNYKTPIITNCNHYFCSKCFIDKSKLNSQCYICKKDTNGSAKMITNMKELLDAQLNM